MVVRLATYHVYVPIMTSLPPLEASSSTSSTPRIGGTLRIPCQCRELLPHCDSSVRALHVRHAHHKRINVPS